MISSTPRLSQPTTVTVVTLLFVRKDILCNLFAIEEKATESFYIELNLRHSKWIINCSYNPHKNNIGTHIDRLRESLETISLIMRNNYIRRFQY